MLNLFLKSLPSFGMGVLITLQITIVALIIATIIGLVVGLINIGKNKILKFIAKIYIDLIRGTPLIVQAFFLYFGMTGALNFRILPETAGIIVISLNAGAYMSEIFRGGIQSIDIGQMEAARSLGLPYKHAMRKVVLPQAIKNMIPAILNQFIISLKDTSLLTIIGVPELTGNGKTISAANYKYFETYLIIGIMYYVIIKVLSFVFSKIEEKLNV